MITASYRLEWHGDAYNRRLLAQLKIATMRSGIKVRDTTKKLLSVSGKAGAAKAGLNRKKTPLERFKHGSQTIQGLKTVTSRKLATPVAITFGGANRMYWYGEPLDRWVQSSQPGTPPHRQHGELQRRIAVESINGGLRVKVGPSNQLIYGRIQELGGRGLINLPARPYLRPAFQSQFQAIMFQYSLAIARASK